MSEGKNVRRDLGQLQLSEVREPVFFSRSSAISRWAVSMPHIEMGGAEEVKVALMVTAILE